MSKQIFIIFTTLVILIFSIIACSMVRPVKIEKSLSLPFNLDGQLKEVFHMASLAPSSHNTQNWIAKISKETSSIYIFLDDKRVLDKVDPDKREAYISIGAFVKTLEKSLNAYGYENQTSINNDGNSPLAATIYYNKLISKKDSHSLSIIEKRNTNKAPYKNRALPKDIIHLLSKNNDIYYHPLSSAEGQHIANGTINAYKKQAYDMDKRKELSSWLRFSDKEAKEKKDGLPAEQLGLSNMAKFFYYLTVNKESSTKDSFADAGIKKTINQVNNCSGFFIITGHNNKSDLIKTGMVLQSFWLDATEKNIAIHPMSQILEEEPYKDLIQSKLKLNKPVQMILRAGIVDSYGKNNKIRREVKDFLFLEE